MHLPEFALLAIATVAAIAAGFGVGMLALGRPRFGVVRGLFWISALTFASLGIVWSATSTQPLWVQMAAAGAIGAVAFAGLAWGLWEVRIQERIESTESAESSKLVSQAQFSKVAELEQFLGGKDEMDLRIVFDLPNIIKKNIATQVIRITFIKAGREKEFLYTNFTDNGNLIAWVKEGHYTTGPSGLHIEAGPKDVLYLVTTTKFQVAQKRLIEFANSALIPNSIKTQVTGFNDTINKNTSLMMEILDQRMHENENYFLQNGKMGTPYYGVILTDFAKRVAPLKPAADRVLGAIAQSWKISK